MTRAGAIAILTTVFMGLFAWAGTEIVSIKERVVRNETERETSKEILKEIRQEQREMRKELQHFLYREK